MEPGGGDHSAHSPGRSSYDPASLLGASALEAAAAAGLSGFGGLSHLPSAFSMLGRLPMFPSPVPFGGLGGLQDPLRGPPTGPLGHLSPSTGLNGSVSSSSDTSSMFQLPSFSSTTTTTTTTTSASTSYKSPGSTTSSNRNSTTSSSSSSEKKPKNPLSVESLTKAENAVMSPFFFPFGTVSTTMPTMPSPYASHLMPGADVMPSLHGSGLFSPPPPPGMGLFPPPPMSLATSSPSSSATYPFLSLPKVTTTASASKDSTRTSTTASSPATVMSSSVITSPKTSRERRDSDRSVDRSVDRTGASRAVTDYLRDHLREKEKDHHREKDQGPPRDQPHGASPNKAAHTPVITGTPASSKSATSTPATDKPRHSSREHTLHGHDIPARREHHVSPPHRPSHRQHTGEPKQPHRHFSPSKHDREPKPHRSPHPEHNQTLSRDSLSSPRSRPTSTGPSRECPSADSALNLSLSSTHSSAPSEQPSTNQDGVMDLSMKKPRSSASPAGQPRIRDTPKHRSSTPDAKARPRQSPSSTPDKSRSSPFKSASPKKSTESSKTQPALDPSALFSYPGVTDPMTASAIMEAQKEYLEKHAMGLFSGGSGGLKMAADMSYNYAAAAAAAAMMPPFYDNSMAGMFLHPMMASMAAAQIPPSSGTTSSSSSMNARGRGRGRGRGRSRGRGRTNVGMFKAPEPPEPEPDRRSSSRGRGRGRGSSSSSGRGGRGSRGVAAPPVSSAAGSNSFMGLPMAELEWQQRLRQEQLRHQLEAEMKQQQMQAKLAQRAEALREKDAAKAARENYSDASRLAQALMGKEGKPSGRSSASSQEARTKSVSEGTSGSLTDDFTEGSLSETDSQSAQDSETSGSSRKRRSFDPNDPLRKKRRRTIFDESGMVLPLASGWRRETRIRSVNERGVFGEVVYYAPCGKKLRTYPEVERYMKRQGMTEFSRDHFTFSTQVNIGEFLEYQPGEPGEGFRRLTETEVSERYIQIEARRKRIWERKVRSDNRKDRKQMAEEMARRMAEARHSKRAEQQNQQLVLARKVQEIKNRKKMERQQQRDAMRRAKQLRAVEIKKLRERQRVVKQQEKMQKQRQVQLERELRMQHTLQEKEMKRHQVNVAKDQEKERRRQHLLLLKAIDARKKMEEKERQKEEKKEERRILQLRRMEQRRVEMEMAREMKKPVEDMCLRDSVPLPDFPRIEGMRLSGVAFSDCLMVAEFMQNFGAALGFDASSLPTLNVIQSGLYNDPRHVDELNMFVMQLLRNALDDPGVPNPKEATTLTGQKIMEVDLNEHSISEVLSIFIRCRNGNKDDEMSLRLKDHPFQALTPTHKAAILAFLCNELLCGKNISGELDKNIETINNLRRDKWVAEGRLRKMRMIQAKRYRQAEISRLNESADAALTPGGQKAKKDGSDEEDEAESDHGAEGTILLSDDDEDQGLTSEELDKKIEKIHRQHASYNDRVADQVHKLRGVSLGQDRYQRRFWVLPHCGGVFIEGAESAETESEAKDRRVWLQHQKDHVDEVTQDPKEVSQSQIKQGQSEVIQDQGKQGEVLQGQNEVKQALEVNGQQEVVKDSVDSSQRNGSVDPSDLKSSAQEALINSIHNSEIKDHSKDPHKESETCQNAISDHGLLNGVSDKAPVITEEMKPSDLKVAKSLPLVNGVSGNVLADALERKPEVTPGVDSKKLLNGSLIADVDLHKDLKIADLKSPKEIKTENAVCTPLKVPSIKTSQTFRSIDSLLNKDAKPIMSSQKSFTQSILPTSLYLSHEHLMKNMSVPVGGNGEILSSGPADTKASTSPWFSLLPRQSCDQTTAVTWNHLDKQRVSPQPVDTTALANAPLWADNDPENPFKQLEKLQYSTPQKIPLEQQQNWWKICDVETLRKTTAALHPRGIRERNMQKNIERFMDLAIHAIGKGKLSVVDLSDHHTDTPLPIPEDDALWRPDIGRDVELGVLDEIENMEDRICHASLQGFKMPAKVKETDLPNLMSQDIVTLTGDQRYILDVAKTKLLALERNIERRYMKPPFVKSTRLSLASLTCTPPKERERDRDRSDNVDDSMESHDGDLDEHDAEAEAAALAAQEEEEALLRSHVPKDLHKWRECVQKARSASQIMVYLLQLNDCIAWEKSIMKVSCQICCHDDNEAELLLCDSCDKGYHTYCFKPKMEDIPDGDWYCYECISRATGEACCVVCGKAGPRLVECDYCPRSMHTECMNPPLGRMPKKWACAACGLDKLGKCKKKKHRLPSTSSSASVVTLKDLKSLSSPGSSAVECPSGASTPKHAPPASAVTSPAHTPHSSDDKTTAVTVEKKQKKPKKEPKPKKADKPKQQRRKNTEDDEERPKRKRRQSDPAATPEPTPEKKRKKREKNEQKKKRKQRRPKAPPTEEVVEHVEQLPAEPELSPTELDLDDEDHQLVIDTGGEDSSAPEDPAPVLGQEEPPTTTTTTVPEVVPDLTPIPDSTDLSACVCIMEELLAHEDAWPFLSAVDGRRFPSYRKVIKKPMDFNTMRKKLRDNVYRTREEFAADAVLVCDNCLTYNEDDSAVGRAGHSVRAFFTKRWRQLCCNGTNAPVL